MPDVDPSSYPAVVEPVPASEGGGFLAYAPDLPGCFGDGETQEAALADLRSAVLEWCDENERLGRELPLPFTMQARVGFADDRMAATLH